MVEPFDYSARFGLLRDNQSNRIVLGSGDVELPFHFKVNSPVAVELIPGRSGEVNAGFRLFASDMSNVIYEGRILKDPVLAFPEQWIPSNIKLPRKALEGIRNAVLVFDLVNEHNYWFAERGGPKYAFELEFLDSLKGESSPGVEPGLQPPAAAPSTASGSHEPEAQSAPAPFSAAPIEVPNGMSTLSQAGSLGAAPRASHVLGAAPPKPLAPARVAPLPSQTAGLESSMRLAPLRGPGATVARSTVASVVSAPANRRTAPADEVNAQSHVAPSRRAAVDAVARSALSHCFRMRAVLLEADAARFRAHCYRTLLRREPEPELNTLPISFAGLRDRIGYWKSIILSQEFGAGQAVPPSQDLAIRIQESLGWSAANTLLGYALRIESVTAGAFPQFINRIGDYIAANSFDSSDVGDLFETEEPELEFTALFEGLVDLAVEFSLGIARLDELVTRVENIELRAGIASKASRIDVPSAYGLDPLATQHGPFGLAAANEENHADASARRRKPNRWPAR